MGDRLVVLMLDGFRWDYYDRDRANLNGFGKLLGEGVQAESLVPVYPVESYPNWTTIGTGVYVDKHGISGNYMFNKDEAEFGDAIFSLNDIDTARKPQWWKSCPEPIWVSAMRHEKRTFTRLWGRSDVPIKGVLPEEYSGYSIAPGTSEIRDTLDIGLQKLLEGYDLLMLYGEEIDNIGHKYGPDSTEMYTAVREVDESIDKFLAKLEAAELHNQVNVIIISDHGMTATGESSGTKYFNIEDFVDEDDVQLCSGCGPYASLLPFPDKLEKVYNQLKSIEGFDVYKRNEIPEELHYKDSKFVLDLHVKAKPHFFLRGFPSRDKQIPCYPRDKPFVEGVHGYTPDMRDQHGIFFARGPAFRKNVKVPSIHMVDLYQVMAHVLKIPALSHDGKWARVAAVFDE